MSGPVDKFGRPIVAGCFLVGAWRYSSSCGLHLWRVVDVDSDGRVWVVRRADYGDGVTKRSRLWSLDNVAVFDNPPAAEVTALAGAQWRAFSLRKRLPGARGRIIFRARTAAMTRAAETKERHMADDSITLKVTLPTAREGWQVFAKACDAGVGAVWPSAVVEAFEAGADVPAALAAGYAACDSDDGPFGCVLPLEIGAPVPVYYRDTPRADGAPGRAWTFGSGRSRAEISADGRTVTVRGPMDSSVGYRANAHPRLMAQYRVLEAEREAAELLAQARRSRPLAGRDCRELVRL